MKRALRLLGLLGIAAVAAAIAGWTMTMRMPGTSAGEPLPEPTAAERAIAGRLRADVHALAGGIGERNMFRPTALARAADYIAGRLREAGLAPRRERYRPSRAVLDELTGPAENVIAEIPGREAPDEIIVVGAHYDTVRGSPGANDNASGVAVLLALARALADDPQPRTVRLIAFANEEAPFYLSADMGSHVHADGAREAGEDIRAMISLDGVGYFDTDPGSQRFPIPGLGLLYPDRGDFIGFVTRWQHRSLLYDAIRAFRERASLPSEGAALPAAVPGVAWSDHWSFWQHGYPAFLITDTLPFRDPHYHTPQDTAERLDYERMARLAAGLRAVVRALAERP